MNGPGTRGVDLAVLTCPEIALAGGTSSISHLDFAEALENPARSGALVCWNNIATSSPRQGWLRCELEREDLLHVCLDLFATDTTAHADWVLPYFQHTVSLQVKAASLPARHCLTRRSPADSLAPWPHSHYPSTSRTRKP